MKAAVSLSDEVGRKPACDVLGVPRSTFYRHLNQPMGEKELRPRPPLALTNTERQTVVDTLHSERFQDKSPYQVYATLLDEGQYHCSIRTMYRILTAEHNGVRERRNHVQRPNYTKPEYVSDGPQSSLVMGHHKIEGACQVDLLLSLCNYRHL